MEKRKLHHYWIVFKKPTLYILIASCIIWTSVAVLALRQNNVRMIELKQAVYLADEKNGDIETALQDLRGFVNSHMNTRMRSPDATEPPVQLVHQFDRYVAAEQAKLANQDTNKVYRDAQAQCENGNIPLTARAQCMQDYILTNSSAASELSLPPKELYTFDFASPSWSPDIAGFAIIFAGISYILLLIRLVAGRLLKHYI